MSFESKFKVSLDVWPFTGQDAVHHRIANRTVTPRPMVANHAVLLGTQRFNGAL
jgi:hypothetical protein